MFKHTAQFVYTVFSSKTGETLTRVSASNLKEAAEWAIARYGAEQVLVQRSRKAR